MDIKDYIKGVLDLEIVEQLYILRESEDNSENYLVSATRLDETDDLVESTKILDRKFTYSPAKFETFKNSLEEIGLHIAPFYSQGYYPGCPYRKKYWIVTKK